VKDDYPISDYLGILDTVLTTMGMNASSRLAVSTLSLDLCGETHIADVEMIVQRLMRLRSSCEVGVYWGGAKGGMVWDGLFDRLMKTIGGRRMR